MKSKLVAISVWAFLIGNLSATGNLIHKTLIEPFTFFDKFEVAFFITCIMLIGFFAGKEK